MEHLVRFTTAEGREGHHYADSLDAGVGFVERLRNAEEASDVRLFRLREVPIEFKAYYKVEVRGAEADGEDELPATPLPPVPSMSSLPAAHDDPGEQGHRPLVAAASSDAETDGASGRRLFQRG